LGRLITDMILTRNEIFKEIQKKRIKVEPFDKNDIGPASIDLCLGNELRVFQKKNKIIVLNNHLDYFDVTQKISLGKGYVLKPGELVMGITKEKITLPEDICGWLQSRSRFARFGLMSHITAPFVSPGVSNHQVLEIYNASPRKLKLIPGLKICHLILERCHGKSKYEGRFSNQRL